MSTKLASLCEVIERLERRGYTAEFRADRQEIVARDAGCRHAPEAVRVDEVVRFEGPTDPDEQAILFAVRCLVHAVRGTYVAVYGPGTPPEDAEVVRGLGLDPSPAPAVHRFERGLVFAPGVGGPCGS